MWVEFGRYRTRVHLSENCAERFRKALCMPVSPIIIFPRPTTLETGRMFTAVTHEPAHWP